MQFRVIHHKNHSELLYININMTLSFETERGGDVGETNSVPHFSILRMKMCALLYSLCSKAHVHTKNMNAQHMIVPDMAYIFSTYDII